MTEPLSPDDALVLSYVDGTLDDRDRAAFDARLRADAALRAEVDGLIALRALLDDDARHGQSAGLDVPPPHLVDAIVRAEVAARPDAIRAAVLRVADDAAAARPWWSRLSSWLVGGSLVGAGATALLLVVSRADAPAAPAASPAMFEQQQAVARAIAPSPLPPPPPLSAALAAEGAADPVAPAVPGVAGNVVAPRAVAVVPAEADDAADGAADKVVAVVAHDEAESRGRFAFEKKAAPAKDALAEASPAVVEAARGGAVGASMDGALALQPARLSTADLGDGASSTAAAPAAAAAGSVTPLSKSVAARTSSSPPPEVAAEAPAAASRPRPSIPRTREEFLEQRRADARAKAGPGGAGLGELRAELGHARRAQAVNELLLAAEHELSLGRAAGALELAQRAEVEDRAGVLGLLPAAAQVRAYAMLQRNVDASRVASRLLRAPAGEPAVVDALVAGADAAVAVGDRGLARRLLLRALDPANQDARRRAAAQQRLDRLGAGEAAKAKAEGSTASPGASTTEPR